MKLSDRQKDAIERGWAMTYAFGSGEECYIEAVLDAYDRPSGKYRGMVYVFDLSGNLVDRGEDTYEPFPSLDAAKEFCDRM